MHAARALTGHRQIRLDRDMQFRRCPARPHVKDMHPAFAIGAGIDPRLAHVHHLRQQGFGRGQVRDRNGDRAKAADLMIGGHRAVRPRLSHGVGGGDQAQALSLGVLDIKAGAAIQFGDLTAGHTQIA